MPSADYIEPLLNNDKLKECQQQNEVPVELILDFSPQSIITCTEYQSFIKSFPEDTKHLMLNESNK